MNGRLTDQERTELIALAGSLVPAEDIRSICASGPKVAGYGDGISFNDLVIITKRVKDAEQHHHRPGQGRSPLVIEEKALRNAAEGTSALSSQLHHPMAVSRYPVMEAAKYAPST